MQQRDREYERLVRRVIRHLDHQTSNNLLMSQRWTIGFVE